MGAQGQAVVDFGVAPGNDRGTVVVTGQAGILASSLCEAWLDATVAATADHTPDEHSMAATDFGVTCQTIVAGTGFTIVISTDRSGRAIGKFNVAWVWN